MRGATGDLIASDDRVGPGEIRLRGMSHCIVVCCSQMCPWRSEAFAVLKIRLGVFVLGFRKPVGRMVECVQLYIHVVPRVVVFYRFLLLS